MKIIFDGIKFDTKFDLGFKTDEDFVNYLLQEYEKKRSLIRLVRRLMNELPSNRDWLDPDLEKLINELINE
jgi:hypothetical protein